MRLKVIQWMAVLLLLATNLQAQSIWDATHLANVKQSLQTPFYATAYQELKSEADKLLDVQPLSVMMKEKTPGSGNKHDYMSLARYYWPDPTKPDGLPAVTVNQIRSWTNSTVTVWEILPDVSLLLLWHGISVMTKNMPKKQPNFFGCGSSIKIHV